MAKIRNSRPKNPSGGFNRLFDDEALGFLMSKVQSTVIANGSELEKVITELAPTVENLDSVLENPGLFPDGTYLVPKKQIKKSTICHIHTIDASGEKVKLPEPDFFIGATLFLPCFYQRTVVKIDIQMVIIAAQNFHFKHQLRRFAE